MQTSYFIRTMMSKCDFLKEDFGCQRWNFSYLRNYIYLNIVKNVVWIVDLCVKFNAKLSRLF